MGWQIYEHPKCNNEVVPIHEVIKNQAERENDPSLKEAEELFSKIMNSKTALILGDRDYKFLR